MKRKIAVAVSIVGMLLIAGAVGFYDYCTCQDAKGSNNENASNSPGKIIRVVRLFIQPFPLYIWRRLG